MQLETGLTALVRDDDLSGTRKAKARYFFRIGDRVEITIKAIDVQKMKIWRSIVRRRRIPGRRFRSSTQVGSKAVGVVGELFPSVRSWNWRLDFRHWSTTRKSLGPRRAKACELLRTGDSVEVAIMHIDAHKRRIYVSYGTEREIGASFERKGGAT